MNETPTRLRALSWLAPVLLLAAALRLSGIDYGIPHPTARPDEERIVGRAQTIFATGNWHPGSFVYPSLTIYAGTLALHGYYLAGKLAGAYERPFDFLFDIAVERPGLHYRIARWMSAMAGVATVALAYALGAAASRRREVGLLAALFLAVAHVHVRDSHFATVDVLMTLFVTLALLFSVRAARGGSLASFVLAGVFTGLAASAKYNAGLVALAVAAAFVVARPALSRGAAAALAAAASFACTSPYVVLAFAAVRDDLAHVSRVLYGDGTGPLAVWEHLRTTFPAGLGWPLFLLSVAGVARALARRRATDLVLLAFLLPFFAHIASVTLVFPRYVLPLVPVLLVLAADTLVALAERLPRRRLALGFGAAAVVVSPLASSISFDRVASAADTRLQAANWLAENAAPRSRVLVCDGYGASPVNEDRRRPPAFVVERVDCFGRARLENGPADFVVTHEHEALSSYSRVHPDLARWLETNARLVRRFAPHRRPGEETPYFYPSDAFYIPYDGISGVERGGPVVSLWKLP